MFFLFYIYLSLYLTVEADRRCGEKERKMACNKGPDANRGLCGSVVSGLDLDY